MYLFRELFLSRIQHKNLLLHISCLFQLIIEPILSTYFISTKHFCCQCEYLIYFYFIIIQLCCSLCSIYIQDLLYTILLQFFVDCMVWQIGTCMHPNCMHPNCMHPNCMHPNCMRPNCMPACQQLHASDMYVLM